MEASDDDPAALRALVAAAVARRATLAHDLAAEGTDCYRVFHGAAEGWPGLTIDRYGPLLLAQEFRAELSAEERSAAVAGLGDMGAASLVWRGRYRDAPRGEDTAPIEGCELGARYAVAARHRGLDPWLFLDFRAVRRWLRAHARDQSVLNLFAYTCTAGVAAALGGAREVWNVDFAASNLNLGRDNAVRNGVLGVQHFLCQDCQPVLRQLAGQPVQRRGKTLRFTKVERRTFDVIVLDPPPLARTPFGTIDTARDYESLFKPAWLALAEGGVLLAANNRADVAWSDFESRLRRCAEKAGRPMASLDRLLPEADFPSFDGLPPLKVAVCRRAASGSVAFPATLR